MTGFSRMTSKYLTLMTTGLCLLAACTEEPPPRSVSDFMSSPILLEAAMVRCGRNRAQTKYEAECVNAREASNRIATVEEEARHKEWEARFERKRRALRNTQAAAAEARRRSAEARRLREEAEYLGQFEALPDGDRSTNETQDTSASLPGNQPGVEVVPEPPASSNESAQQAGNSSVDDGGNDIASIREELKRRQASADE